MLSRQWFLLSKIVTLSVSKFEWSKHSPRAAFFENSKPPRMLMSVGLVLCFKAWARVIPFVCCCSSSRIFKTCFLETRRSFGVREGCTEEDLDIVFYGLNTALVMLELCSFMKWQVFIAQLSRRAQLLNESFQVSRHLGPLGV